MPRTIFTVLLTSALVALVGLIVRLFGTVREADPQLYYLMLSAFLGAFFSFLFVRLAEGVSTLYKRRIKHHSTLVLLEHHLNELIVLLDDNIFLAAGFLETVTRKTKDESQVFASANRLTALPIKSDLIVGLTNLDLINDLFAHNIHVRKMNVSIEAITRQYEQVLAAVQGEQLDSEARATYQSNIQRIAKGMESLSRHLALLSLESRTLLGKVRVLARDMPFTSWVMRYIFQLRYSRSFDSDVEEEVDAINAEMESAHEESRKRLASLLETRSDEEEDE